MKPVHGGNVYQVAARLGCEPESILDFSASINPLGPPPGLMEAFNTCFHRLEHYPDIDNHALLAALARFHGMPPGGISAGNGSTEIIYTLPRALGVKRALVAVPTFGEYIRAFDLDGVELNRLATRAETGFQPELEELRTTCERLKPDAVLLTNPGSPAGTLLPPDVRDWVIERASKGPEFFLIDEVFVDYCEEESLKRFLPECPNLALIRSMTKFYGLPGLRLGYLLSSEGVTERMKRTLPPWSVNTFAQIAGTYCLGRVDYQRATLEAVGAAREAMRAFLDNLPGVSVFPASANYVLAHLDDALPPVSALRDHVLTTARVLIRDCSSFEGLNDRYFRLAVRRPEENARALDAVASWIGKQRRE